MSKLTPYRYRCPKRKSLSASMKRTFQREFEVRDYVICPVCGEIIIRYEDSNIAHIKSHFHGGKTEISNLVSVHKRCNRGTDDIGYLVEKYNKKDIVMFYTKN